MFTTLVESRAVRARSTRGAVVSVVLHGTAIAAAVALTMPSRIEARPEPHAKPLVYVAAPIVQHRSAPRPTVHLPGTYLPTPPQLLLRAIPIPAIPSTALPQIELRGPELPDLVLIGGPHRSGGVVPDRKSTRLNSSHSS